MNYKLNVTVIVDNKINLIKRYVLKFSPIGLLNIDSFKNLYKVTYYSFTDTFTTKCYFYSKSLEDQKNILNGLIMQGCKEIL